VDEAAAHLGSDKTTARFPYRTVAASKRRWSMDASVIRSRASVRDVAVGVPEGAEEPLQERGEARLLRPFPVCGKAVERDARPRGERARRVDQGYSVATQTREGAQLIRNALRCLEYGVEVVALQELGAAKAHDIGMYIAANELSAKIIGTLLRFGDRCRCLDPSDLAVLQHLEAGEQEALIDQSPALLEIGRRREAHGLHDEGDQADEWPTVLFGGSGPWQLR
jgi:hypothetical protein